jgi:hypothetical protein
VLLGMTFGFVYWNEASQLGGNVGGFVAGVFLIVFGLCLLLLKKRRQDDAEGSGMPLAEALAAAFGTVGLLDTHGKVGLLRRVHSDGSLARSARAGAPSSVSTSYDASPLLMGEGEGKWKWKGGPHSLLGAGTTLPGQSTAEGCPEAEMVAEVPWARMAPTQPLPRGYGRTMPVQEEGGGCACHTKVYTVMVQPGGAETGTGQILCVREGRGGPVQTISGAGPLLEQGLKGKGKGEGVGEGPLPEEDTGEPVLPTSQLALLQEHTGLVSSAVAALHPVTVAGSVTATTGTHTAAGARATAAWYVDRGPWMKQAVIKR